MKNSYINGMLNFRVELGVIYKKQKYIVKKPQKKKIRRKYFKKFTHKYLLIVLREKKLDF
jgi:exopolysaccharide biosynthesis protein